MEIISITEKTPEKLAQLVNEKLASNEGWELHGTPIHATRSIEVVRAGTQQIYHSAWTQFLLRPW